MAKGITLQELNTAVMQTITELIDQKIAEIPTATTARKGIVQLTNAVNTTSSVLAATATAVKKAYDRADEAFQSASDGKNAVAAAITGKGVPASGSDTFAQLAAKIGQIEIGRKYATGRTRWANDAVTVTGLAFTPNIVAYYYEDSFYGVTLRNTVLGKPIQFNKYASSIEIDYNRITLNDSGFYISISSNFNAVYPYWIAIE